MNERIKELADQALSYTEEQSKLFDTNSVTREEASAWWDKTYNEKFADLIRADEREACAKVCDDEVGTWTGWPQAQDALVVGAIAIRARGNT